MNTASPGAPVGKLSGPPLKGLEAFTLSYQVRWPVTLVLSKKTLTKYELIFRHLFACKHVERMLCGCWVNHQSTKELDLRAAFAASYNLRHRMLHFIQNLVYYMMVEVLEPNWCQLEAQLRFVSTLDEVIQHHNAFLDRCLRECLLNNQQLLQLLSKIMATCVNFAEAIARFTNSFRIRAGGDATRARMEEELRARGRDDAAASRGVGSESDAAAAFRNRKNRLDVEASHVGRIVAQDDYKRQIQRLEHDFDELLDEVMALLYERSVVQADHHLANLAQRMDFNGFYSQKPAAASASAALASASAEDR